MQCRHFTLRLTPQHLIEDEDRLNSFLRLVQVHAVQSSLISPKGDRWSVLVFFEERAVTAPTPNTRRDKTPQASADAAPPELSEAEQRVYERLRQWRSERARTDGVPPYVVAHNATLLQIAREHMSLAVVEDLLPLARFGQQRATRYGSEILRLLQPAGLGEAQGAPLFEDDFAR
jgi:superfamily II DNA helicase RecQ